MPDEEKDAAAARRHRPGAWRRRATSSAAATGAARPRSRRRPASRRRSTRNCRRRTGRASPAATRRRRLQLLRSYPQVVQRRDRQPAAVAPVASRPGSDGRRRRALRGARSPPRRAAGLAPAGHPALRPRRARGREGAGRRPPGRRGQGRRCCPTSPGPARSCSARAAWGRRRRSTGTRHGGAHHLPRPRPGVTDVRFEQAKALDADLVPLAPVLAEAARIEVQLRRPARPSARRARARKLDGGRAEMMRLPPPQRDAVFREAGPLARLDTPWPSW